MPYETFGANDFEEEIIFHIGNAAVIVISRRYGEVGNQVQFTAKAR